MGERIPIPDFWSAFLLVYNNPLTSEPDLIGDLNTLFPFIQHANLDALATLQSTPNDQYYSTEQGSLDSTINFPINGASGVNINVQQAWNYTTGQPYIKAAVLDDGLLLTHQDFYSGFVANPYAGYNSVIKGSWDYVYNDSLNAGFGGSDFGIGHGTQ